LLMLTHMLGPVDEISGMASKGVSLWQLPNGMELHPENEDLGSSTIRLSNGAIGALQAGWCVPDNEGFRLEIWGDKGRILYTDPSFGNGFGQRLFAGDTSLVPFGQRAGAEVEIDPKYFAVPGKGQAESGQFIAMDWMFTAMASHVRGESTTSSPSFAEAAAAHRVVEALFVADRERRTVRVADLN
jgi:predicted dehydrogenase